MQDYILVLRFLTGFQQWLQNVLQITTRQRFSFWTKLYQVYDKQLILSLNTFCCHCIITYSVIGIIQNYNYPKKKYCQKIIIYLLFINSVKLSIIFYLPELDYLDAEVLTNNDRYLRRTETIDKQLDVDEQSSPAAIVYRK